jgi:hypothetical protein
VRTVCRDVIVVLWLCEWLSLCFCESAVAQTARAFVAAEIVSPPTVSKVSDLEFGRVVVGESEGFVTLDGTGQRTAAGGVSLDERERATAGVFSVSGQPGLLYAVLLPQSVVLHSGVDSLQIDNFTHDGGPELQGATEMPVGATLHHIGATLHVAPRQPSGSYVGAFEVIVSYN